MFIDYSFIAFCCAIKYSVILKFNSMKLLLSSTKLVVFSLIRVFNKKGLGGIKLMVRAQRSISSSLKTRIRESRKHGERDNHAPNGFPLDVLLQHIQHSFRLEEPAKNVWFIMCTPFWSFKSGRPYPRNLCLIELIYYIWRASVRPCSKIPFVLFNTLEKCNPIKSNRFYIKLFLSSTYPVVSYSLRIAYFSAKLYERIRKLRSN